MIRSLSKFSGRSEAQIINNVVDTILLETNPMSLDVPKYPVGLDSRVENLTVLLSGEMEGVIKIGLYGRSGVGKTTLARALFNQLLLRSFKGGCFLAKVQEASKTTEGLVSLQQQLISEVLGTTKLQVHTVDQGSKIIQSIICLSKVLVVIDDLGDHKQFESLVGPFASGSVVIVTTRDEEILDKIKIQTKYRYRVDVLDDAESLELFTRHAFGDAMPDKKLLKLSKDILHYAGGLPSALAALGSHLYNQSEVAWKYHVNALSGYYAYETPPSPSSWDVFLSFRGSDTSNGFISHLYDALYHHKVKILRDNPETQKGEALSNEMVRAVQKSRTYVVVFSEHYASSSWCLDGLVEILKSNETMKRAIIVVYYNIEPSVVRHQLGNFKAAFEKHETRYKGKVEKVKEWRRALSKASDFLGYHVSNRSPEVNIVNEVVDAVLLKLIPESLFVAEYPTGLDSRVEDITTLLRSDMIGVTKIGLYGTGGVGKSTLAKALYNQLLQRNFKGNCFLANVRVVSGTTDGLVSLQQQLIDDVLSTKKVEVHNVEQGSKLIQYAICPSKIMVVIDDLDDHKQFESLVGPFASGSVVIVTTRYEEILDKIEVDFKYRVNVLDDAESLELFTRHAFGDAIPDKKLLELSKDILHHAGGLPSALVASGSHLYNQSGVAWRDYIEKHILSKDLIDSDDVKYSILLDDQQDLIESDNDQKDSIEPDDQKDSIEPDALKDSDDLERLLESRKELDEPEELIESNDRKEQLDDPKESIESDDLVHKKTFLQNACCFMCGNRK